MVADLLVWITDITVFDIWTFLHVILTFLMGFSGRLMFFRRTFTLYVGLAIIVAWEFMESGGQFSFFGLHPESFANTIADIAIGMIFMTLGVMASYRIFGSGSKSI